MRILPAAVIVALAASAGAEDEKSRRHQLYDRLREGALTLSEELHRQPIETQRRQLSAVPLSPLGEPASANTVDKLTAAISTDIDDVLAGVSVSPALLVNDAANPLVARFTLQLASVEGGVTRVGARWVIVDHLKKPSVERSCKFDRQAADDALRKLEKHYDELCEKLILFARDSDFSELPTTGVRDTARAACGASGEHAMPKGMPQAQGTLILVWEGLAKASKESLASLKDGKPDDPALIRAGLVRQAVLDTEESYKELKNYRLPIGTECYDDDAIRAAWVRDQWDSHRIRFGVRGQADFFPRKSGLNPDAPDPLPDGREESSLLSADFSWEHHGIALQAGFGYGRERAELTDPLYGSWRPSFSASFVAFSLGGGGVTEPAPQGGRQLRLLEDGTLPPRVVFGVSGEGSYARSKPDTQLSKWNSYKFQLFVDFRVTEKLSFRVGIPYEAKVVTKAAVKDKDGNVTAPEVRDLQKSWPVFVATVIKI